MPYDGRGYDALTSKPVGAHGGFLRTKKDPTRGIITVPIGEEMLKEFKKSGYLIEDGNGWSASGPVLEYMNILMMARETSSEQEGLLSEIAPIPIDTPRCATKYFRDETGKYAGFGVIE